MMSIASGNEMKDATDLRMRTDDRDDPPTSLGVCVFISVKQETCFSDECVALFQRQSTINRHASVSVSLSLDGICSLSLLQMSLSSWKPVDHVIASAEMCL